MWRMPGKRGKHLMEIFKINGYPRSFVKTAFKKRTIKEKTETLTTISIPGPM